MVLLRAALQQAGVDGVRWDQFQLGTPGCMQACRSGLAPAAGKLSVVCWPAPMAVFTPDMCTLMRCYLLTCLTSAILLGAAAVPPLLQPAVQLRHGHTVRALGPAPGLARWPASVRDPERDRW